MPLNKKLQESKLEILLHLFIDSDFCGFEMCYTGLNNL